MRKLGRIYKLFAYKAGEVSTPVQTRIDSYKKCFEMSFIA